MRRRNVSTRLKRINACAGFIHSERRKDPRSNEIIPRHSRYACNDLAGGEIHQVLISEPAAKAPRRLKKSGSSENFIPAIVRSVPQKIAALQPAAVSQKI